MSDYYQVLGVDRDASEQAIKSAYRKLALRYHPDRNSGDAEAEERFKEINEAYAVLSDPERRNRFDRFGSADAAGVRFTGDIFDIFASVFGTGFGGRHGTAMRGQPGEDLETQLTITLEQARVGATLTHEIERLVICDRCRGDRVEPDSGGRRTCLTCGGAGQVQAQSPSIFGTVVTTRTCPECRGQGEVITNPCSQCRGRGRMAARETVDVNLPKGIDGGYRLRIPQQGNAGLDGAPAGDIYVYLELRPHKHLVRDGDDLIFELPVGLAQAALGNSFQVPTLDGPEVIEIPPGTQPDTTFRLRGRGMPRLRGAGFGDQVVAVRVEVPRKLSPKARDLLMAYVQEAGEEIHEYETLVERIKSLFAKRRKGKEQGAAEAN